jgi:cytochrome c
MKKSIGAALAVAAALGAGVVLGQSAEDLMKSKGCLGCHDFDKKKVGPAFKDVAAKHKGNAGAEAALVAKLKDGKGHLKVNASEAEIKTMVGRALK